MDRGTDETPEQAARARQQTLARLVRSAGLRTREPTLGELVDELHAVERRQPDVAKALPAAAKALAAAEADVPAAERAAQEAYAAAGRAATDAAGAPPRELRPGDPLPSGPPPRIFPALDADTGLPLAGERLTEVRLAFEALDPGEQWARVQRYDAALRDAARADAALQRVLGAAAGARSAHDDLRREEATLAERVRVLGQEIAFRLRRAEADAAEGDRQRARKALGG